MWFVVKAVVCREGVYIYSRMVNSCFAFNCSTRDTKVSREAGINFFPDSRKYAINRKNL